MELSKMHRRDLPPSPSTVEKPPGSTRNVYLINPMIASLDIAILDILIILTISIKYPIRCCLMFHYAHLKLKLSRIVEMTF